MRENPIVDKSFAFALEAVRLYRLMCGRREYVLSRQLVRAGTSIGANIEEALAAQSRRDFLAKMSLARKEARESNYWLRLIGETGLATSEEIAPLLAHSTELVRMLTAIILSTRRNPDVVEIAVTLDARRNS